MYVDPNVKSKKALKEAVADPNVEVIVFAPGLGSPPENGTTSVEGPHYPKPHTWYARVEVTNGIVTKVLS